MTDKINLDELRADMDAGTPGPWRVGKGGPNLMPTIGTVKGLLIAVGSHGDNHPTQENARRIARLPDLKRAYLDAIARAKAAETRAEAAEAERDRLREFLSCIAHQKRSDELEAVADVEYADFEDGFDACVNVARHALKGSDE